MSQPEVSLDEKIADPSGAYDTPEEVLRDAALDRDAKRRILESWERDARELQVAEEENMGGGEPAMLGRVLECLAQVSDEEDDKDPASNAKHGG